MSKKILDYISGLEINSSPEEVDATQPFSKILVDDYGYPKNNIQTRPQFRVKVRPSDKKKEFPVDIAVFSDSKKKDGTEYIVVECKKDNVKDGVSQLKDYLRFCHASLGVWFNGKDIRYLRKFESNGKIEFEEIPNIPRHGQKISDIGKFLRRDLKVPKNLKTIFKSSRNYLAANNVGTVRDEQLAQQLINLIFCKIYDEKFTEPNSLVRFRVGLEDSNEEVQERINLLFKEVKSKYKDVISANDKIELDSNSLRHIIASMQGYCIIDSKRDAVSDAFEVFIGKALKGDKGQFFTPRNVVKMMIEIIDPDLDDMILDPASGSGGFLVEALRFCWEKIEKNGTKFNWNRENLLEEKKSFAIKSIHGMELDNFLTKVCKAYMAIIGDGKGAVFVGDSLEIPNNWDLRIRQHIGLNRFNVVITNPPFGKDLKIVGEEKLSQFELGHKWKLDKKNNQFIKTKVEQKKAPQILFIERCLDFLVEGGRLGIVLPDGIYGNESSSYIRSWISQKAKIIAIIDIPLETFLPHTGTKTSVMFLQKRKNLPADYPIFMAVAETCGHDRRGNEIEDDDIKDIAIEFKKWEKENNPYDY
ncbi:N-6 DNA methylase [Prochlorococcus sp. AH-736-D21]|nr:N-6 DNA methylase [Prochlorococcus sp. AH-736-D21]